MAQHARFSIDTGVPVYFCDPRSPWQRGSNENTNGLLRQYFPKRSTDLRLISQAQLDAVPASSMDALDTPSPGGHHHKHSTRRCIDRLRPQHLRGRSASGIDAVLVEAPDMRRRFWTAGRVISIAVDAIRR